MTFYLTPPKEKVTLSNIEEGMTSRLKCLLCLYDNKPVDTQINIEHLYSNSTLDRVSHFMLRLCCLSSETFNKFFIESEIRLFKKRLESFNISSARIMLLGLNNQLVDRPLGSIRNDLCRQNIQAVKNICGELLKERLLSHAFHDNHSNSCRDFIIKVPFMFCGSLMRNREVLIYKGICLVHCGVWKKLLSDNFRSLLLYGIEQLSHSPIRNNIASDIRLKLLVDSTLHLFNKKYYGNTYLGKGKLMAVEVDEEAKLFPPCALNVLRSLHSKRKVHHRARIQLTLFLKDAGMDVDEAIKFWKKAYSDKVYKNGMENNKSCSKKRESYYVYSIKHLYGLKGSRKECRSFSCSYLQSIGRDQGGCPFVSMTGKELMDTLPDDVVPEKRCGGDLQELEDIENLSVKKILELSYKEKPSEACQACFVAHRNIRSKHQLLNKETNDNKQKSNLCGGIVKSKKYALGVMKQDYLSEETICETSGGEGLGLKIKDLEMESNDLVNETDCIMTEASNAMGLVEPEAMIRNAGQYYLTLKSMEL